MNIIYMLENVDKKEGRRFYIGSKQECQIEVVDGLNRIVSCKTGRLYYGSSTCLEMKADMQRGCRFNAKVLEEVPNKKFLLDAENKWMRHYNAVESEEFYNKNYATVGVFNVDQTAPYNEFGETIMGYGKLMSSLNKKNGTAIRFGFENLGEFCVWIWLMRERGATWPQIADEMGWERHQPKRYTDPYNMVKCISEYEPRNEELKKKVRFLYAKNASVNKIAELEGLEIPTVLLYLGNYTEVNRNTHLVAYRQGLTKEELEVKVTKLILDGKNFTEASKILSIDQTSAKRYFFKCIRRKFKSSDLD